MKIIHTSDLHLNSPLSSKLPPAKVAERRRELASLLPRLKEEADRVGASAIIIAGDLFDSERLNKKNRDRALSVIERASHITFFYLPGNHERDALAAGGELPKNLVLFDKDWSYADFHGITIAARTDTAPDMFSTLSLNPDKTNLVVLHGELRQHSDFGSVIGALDSRELGIDYLALGHYHSYSKTQLSERTVAVYSGAPEGRGFDEAGAKGYVLINIENGVLEHKFVKFANRTLHICEIDISNAQSTFDILRLIEEKTQDIPRADIVRAVLVGHYRVELKKDLSAILGQLQSRFYFFEIKDESRLYHSPELYKNDKSLKGEFIRLVLGEDSLSEEQKERIISFGLSALVGEAFDD